MRLKVILTGLLLTLTGSSLLLGCTPQQYDDSDSVLENSTNIEDSTTVNSEDNTQSSDISMDDSSDSDEQFEFSTASNASYADGSGKVVEQRVSVRESENLSINLLHYVKPDKTLPQHDIPLRIRVVADGVPIPFKMDGTDGEVLSHDILVDAEIDYATNICFTVTGDMRLIYILEVYFPEDIPSRGLGAYGGVSVYPIVNMGWNGKERETNSEGYTEITPKENSYGIDIGTTTIEEMIQMRGDGVEPLIEDNHFFTDTSVHDGQPLYVKFNSRDTEQTPFYLLVLRDGVLLDKLFNGSCSVKVDCKGGTQAFQYEIPRNMIPESGLHTFQAIALPATDQASLIPLFTSKIRVQS